MRTYSFRNFDFEYTTRPLTPAQTSPNTANRTLRSGSALSKNTRIRSISPLGTRQQRTGNHAEAMAKELEQLRDQINRLNVEYRRKEQDLMDEIGRQRDQLNQYKLAFKDIAKAIRTCASELTNTRPFTTAKTIRQAIDQERNFCIERFSEICLNVVNDVLGKIPDINRQNTAKKISMKGGKLSKI